VSPPGQHAQHRGLITASVMLASLMQSLDNTIANVALPHIQGSLSATQDQMTWILTSYIVAAAITIPLCGWLAGRVGRRRVFLYSVAGFTLASALCGMAATLPEIVLARLFQGVCGAALVPMSQAVLLDINPPEEHARAMSMWITAVVVGPILGPILGGWLTENYNWRWVFFINVPFGLLAFAGIAAYMRETETHVSRFDFFGFSTLSIAIGALQIMLDRGQVKDWFNSTEIWIEAVICALATYLFVLHMLTTDKPAFVRPALFKDRNFLTGSVFIFVVGVVLFACLALMPPLLQNLMGYPVVLTGLVTAPRGVGMFLAMFVVGRLVGRVDTRLIIATGFLLTAYSLMVMTTFNTGMDTWPVVWSGLVQGVGTGLVYVPLAAVTFATLSSAYRNEGTAMFNLLRNVGSSVGISTVQALLTRNTQIMHSRLAEQVTPFGHGLGAWTQAELTGPGSLARINQVVTAQAEMIAYNNDFQLMMILTLCVVPLVALLRVGKRTRNPEPVILE